MLDSEAEGKADDNNTYEANFDKRLRQENNSYYKTSNISAVLVPNSCQSKYETHHLNNSKFMQPNSKKVLEIKRSSMPRQSSLDGSGSARRKSCKAKKNKGFNRILSEKILETKPKSRNGTARTKDQLNNTIHKLDKPNTKRSRVAKFDLLPTSNDCKTVNGLPSTKAQLPYHRSRNASELQKDTSINTVKRHDSPKKLISTLKKTEESSGAISEKRTNFTRISKRFDILDKNLEAKKTNSIVPTSMVSKYLNQNINKVNSGTKSHSKLPSAYNT